MLSYSFHLQKFPNGIYKDESEELILFYDIADLIIAKWVLVDYEDNIKRNPTEKQYYQEQIDLLLENFTLEFFDDNSYLRDTYYELETGMYSIDIGKRILTFISDTKGTDKLEIKEFDGKNLLLIHKIATNNTITKFYFEKNEEL